MTIDLRKDAPNQVSNVNPDELSNEINTLLEIKKIIKDKRYRTTRREKYCLILLF